MHVTLKIFRPVTFLWTALCLSFLVCCNKKEGVSDRENALMLLTNSNSKDWVLDRSTIDDKEIIPSKCDSNYVLTMRSNFTFREIYLSPVCSPPSYGDWELNDENNVITISFIDNYSGIVIEKRFEIVELSEKFLAYQSAQNNKLKYVRLKNMD